MSTRATYLLKSNDHRDIAIYIHYDGYESGAAAYFWAAHHYAEKRGGFACQFLRANALAEFTEGHDAHGDTEYRYTLDGETLTAYKRKHGWNENEEPSWPVIFVGPWWEFVNANPESIEGFTALRKLSGGGVWSGDQLIAYVEQKQAEADAYALKFPQYTGNIDGARRDIQRLRAMIEEYRAQGGPAPTRVIAPATCNA